MGRYAEGITGLSVARALSFGRDFSWVQKRTERRKSNALKKFCLLLIAINTQNNDT
jgi:hypothetical protein